jgi:hypothetical protein
MPHHFLYCVANRLAPAQIRGRPFLCAFVGKVVVWPHDGKIRKKSACLILKRVVQS